MAEKRMFSKKITDSDVFVELSSSTQALYFHLNQGADDDGFNNQVQNAMFKAHASADDLKVLLMKNFIIRFESGVIVIKHWRMHNTLRKDRYTPTSFQEELSALDIKDNGSYTLIDNGCQVVAKRLPQNSIDKNSIDKNSINNIYAQKFEKFWKEYPKKTGKDKSKKWFEKNKPDDELFELMMSQLERFKDTEDWKKQGGQYIPYPTSWLNGKRWEDEFETDTEIEIRIEKEIIEGTYGIEGC